MRFCSNRHCLTCPECQRAALVAGLTAGILFSIVVVVAVLVAPDLVVSTPAS